MHYIELLFLAGCASSGAKLSNKQLKQVTVGKTTEQQLIRIAGNPNFYHEARQTGTLPVLCGPKGAPIKHLLYNYAEGSLSKGTSSEIRSFYLNDSGVVCYKALAKSHVPTF